MCILLNCNLQVYDFLQATFLEQRDESSSYVVNTQHVCVEMISQAIPTFISLVLSTFERKDITLQQFHGE